MTISTTQNKAILAGDGVTTSFPFSFSVRSAADLQVIYTDASGNVTTLASNLYSVALNAIPAGQLYGAGGTVTYPLASSPIATGTNLTILRSVSLVQTSSLINQGGYFPQVVEQALDVLTMAQQQLQESIGRSLTIPVSSTAATALPTPVANMVLGWNATGTAIVNIAAPAGAVALPAGGGIAVYTGGGTFISRSLVAGSGISITNADGQAGNPTIATAIANKGGIHVGTGGGSIAEQAVGSNGAVLTADSTQANGVAWAVPGFTTGDVKLTLKTVADVGWVLMNDTTIGDASSGGTGRANADTSALFTLLWNNTADADCAVSTGRGGSAAADYAAHKTIALPKALGRALATYGTGVGLTARALAHVVGEETHVLITAEMPSHSHTPAAGTNFMTSTGAGQFVSGASGGITGGTSSTGGDGPHNNMQPTLFLNTMIKL
jgi:hypothetical protein